MVATSFILAALSLATAAFAAPIRLDFSPLPLVPRTLSTVGGKDYGLDGSLGNFDDFYGSNNFHGRAHKKVIIKQEEKLVCRRVQVTVVQQQLTVVRELMKRIITRQICDVELQTVIIQQMRSHFKSFHQDIRRSGAHDSVSYDERIANMYSQIVGSDGDLSDQDMGFHGNDVGQNSRSVGGDNYNANTSPAKISAIFKGSIDLAKAQDKTDITFN
jgi:hypothetical protein